MLPRQTSLPSLLLGGLALLVLALSGGKLSTALFVKAKEQEQALADFRLWRSTYDALAPVQDSWNQSFQPVDSARDMLSLHRLMATSLKTNLDKMAVGKIERVKVSGHELGLSRVCLTTPGESGFVLQGESVSHLVSALKSLAARPDVEMDEVKVVMRESRPTALVHNFCLLLRDGD